MNTRKLIKEAITLNNLHLFNTILMIPISVVFLFNIFNNKLSLIQIVILTIISITLHLINNTIIKRIKYIISELKKCNHLNKNIKI